MDVRALHEELANCRALVRRGRLVTLTTHGRAIAQITPLIEGPASLAHLIATGQVTPPSSPRRPAPPPVKANATVSDLVSEQRP